MRPSSEVCVILKRIREDAGLSQAELARRMRVQQTTVSRWEKGAVPAVDLLYKIEVEGFGLEPGSVLREIGYVSDSEGVEGAILADSRLSPTARRMMSAAYEAAIDG